MINPTSGSYFLVDDFVGYPVGTLWYLVMRFAFRVLKRLAASVFIFRADYLTNAIQSSRTT